MMISMNDLGLFVVGNFVRVTLFACFGLVFAALFRRRGPAAGASVATGILAALVVVSALGVSPWPRWWTIQAQPRTEQASQRASGSLDVFGLLARNLDFGSRPTPASSPSPEPKIPARPASPAPSPSPSWNIDFSTWEWPAWVGLGFLILVGVGFGRLALGLVAVTWLRKLSQPINDVELDDLAAVLCAELSCTRSIELREVSGAVTPSTFGCFRPVILLPSTWRGWDETERRAVLAHELAHVCRGDFLAGVLAQVSLSLHFYHPLAHWLVGRMRLQQELAADAWGAQLLGGNRTYLTALARMALRRDDLSLGWSTRAFLPTRGTLLKRIEMLKDLKTSRQTGFSRSTRVFVGTALAAAALVVAGLRGPLSPVAIAAPQAPASGDATFDLAKLPADTDMAVSIQVRELYSQPTVQKLVEVLTAQGEPVSFLGTRLPIAETEQILIIWSRPAVAAPDRGPSFGQGSHLLVRATKPQRWAEVMTRPGSESSSEVVNGKTLVQFNSQGAGPPGFNAYAIIDDRTVALGDPGALREFLTQRAPVVAPHAWDEALKQITPGQLTLLVNSRWVSQLYVRATMDVPKGRPNPISSFEPLWTSSSGLALSIGAKESLTLDADFVCDTDEAAEEVSKTTTAALVLGQNMFRSIQQNAPPGIGKLVDGMLKSTKVEHAGKHVRVRGQSDVKMADLMATLTPAVNSAREAARRTQSMNNLKMIGLAMHNYHDANGKFPPAVLYGPDGKTPHSWRVAILPYIDQQPLYTQYKMDEPWDSPSNLKVLEKMPAIYASSPAEVQKHASSYYVLTGPTGIFSAVPNQGRKLPEVTDGLSNTILAVEAKREIPWTRPEDIPYDRAKPLPELGGFAPNGFNALLGDGSVRFIAKSINEHALRALISSAGGEVVAQ